ncbi:MAG: hypothetical protein HY040_17090 [Planctomycetes bacterium]|nr:hypothetical protein [Planctomycetota bacterium]
MSLVRGLILTALLAALPSAAVAQNLDDILNRDRLLVQKLFDEVNKAVEKSRTLQKNEPAKARVVLEEALAKIQGSENCPEDQKALLRRRVNTRMTDINNQLREVMLAAEEAVRKEADKAKRENNTGPPKNPSDVAKNAIVTMKDQLAAHERIRSGAAKGRLGVLNQLTESVVPMEGSLEYPKYWAQLTENRKVVTGQKLADKEIAMLKALNSTLSVDFNKTPFREVIDYLNEKTGQTIYADEPSLKDANVEYDDPVTFKVKKVTLRTVLRKVLADKGLSYILRDGNIEIVTIQKARETMVVRAYPISDLVGSGSPEMYGPFVAYQIRMQNVQILINNIQTAIDPSLWEPQGGPGRITYNEAANALLIRAPAEMHYMMGGGSLMGR